MTVTRGTLAKLTFPILLVGMGCAAAAERTALADATAPSMTGIEPRGVRIDAGPADALDSVPFTVRIDGIAPGTRVDIAATLDDVRDRRWLSRATFVADSAGMIDTARQPALAGGSYHGVDAAGLACGMHPLGDDAASGPGRPAIGRDGRFAITLSVAAQGQSIGTTTIVRRVTSPDLIDETVNDGGIVGRYVEPPPGVARKIPVLLLSGSSGGINETNARILASLGHPVLAQAYFGYPGTGKTDLVDIPIEIFGAGIEWLARRSGVERVALMGVSRGSEAVQLTAIHFPRRVAGVVAMVPAALVHSAFGPTVDETRAGWTFGGRPLPYVRLGADYNRTRLAAVSPPGFVGTPYFQRAWADPAVVRRTSIPVERIHAPLLLLAAERDDVWPSALGARMIVDRLNRSGRAGSAEMHVYPGAGHGITFSPIHGALPATVATTPRTVFTSAGGDTVSNCRAGYAALADTRRFLDRIARRTAHD